MIPVFKPSLGDEESQAVNKVLESGWIGNGPKTKEFEDKFLQYTGGRFGVALNSASAAIHLALLAAGVGKGDEVITPSLTFVATNHPILMVGAKPVFCDIDEETLCADPADIEKKITSKTKAITVVHYGGHPVDLEPLIKICRQKKIMLIEDCAHGAGTKYKGKHVGVYGDFSCFSFAAIKNLTTGDGGMLLGRSSEAITYARTLAWSGISQSTWERTTSKRFKWQYDIRTIGWKYQMNDIAASIGLVQLKKLDEGNRKRKKITKHYNEAFKDVSWITTPVVREYAESSYHNYAIQVAARSRDRLSDYLAEKGIATSVHYVPSHYYNLYKEYKAVVPITEKAWKKILLLPIFPDLAPTDQERVVDAIKKFTP